MSRYTDPDSDQYRCLHCGNEKDDHGLAVNEAGIVVAGTWRGDEYIICGEAALDAMTAERDGCLAALREGLIAYSVAPYSPELTAWYQQAFPLLRLDEPDTRTPTPDAGPGAGAGVG